MGFFSEYKTVQKIIAVRHAVVVYAESRHYYQYFERLVNDLLQQQVPVLYITSDRNDPMLSSGAAGIEVVYIHWWLGFLFPRVKADVFIMTMTDLDNYAFKRSKEVSCYVYVFHAMVSTHLQYTPKAFYHYDAVFCPGPSHVREIKAAEKKYQLRQKDTIEYGYPLIDVLNEQYERDHVKNNTSLPVILIAPSWYKECILETCMEELVQQLAAFPYNIVIRPHPEYVKRRPKKWAALQQQVSRLSNVSFDDSPEVLSSLSKAAILITDRSGIAFEYALGLQRPVLFIDTPLKVMNAAWEELTIEPIENKYRERMGVTLAPNDISHIDHYIEKLRLMEKSFAVQAEMLKKELLFNSDESYNKGVSYIRGKVKL